ncbi:MAG: peptidoglycan editing factor PgeF [Candidatus Hydrothermae bacterium]|nr:peptidoglycan editing factor PgeF [Candidatus Hydrothermae bacterium]
MGEGWVLKHGKVPYLEYRNSGPFRIFFSTKYGLDFTRELGVNPIVHLNQVHSNRIIHVIHPDYVEEKNGDGLVTSNTGFYLAVKVADCYPLIILDHDTPACGIFHVGWRGLKDGIVEKAVRYFEKHFYADPKRLKAIFGPGIKGEYYEVGEEFREYFTDSLIEKNGKLYLDIYGKAKTILLQKGITNITEPPYDTYSNEDLFFSKRRDGEVKGLMWAIVGIKKNAKTLSMLESETPL